MSYLSKIFKTDPRLSRGFTVAEMITVTAIFVIVTGILLTNLPDFKSKTNIDVAAQAIALNIRGAQVFSLGTRIGQINTGGSLSPSYGVFFSLNNPNAYLLYQDAPQNEFPAGNSRYTVDPGANPFDCSLGSECQEVYRIDPYFFIKQICKDNDCPGNNPVTGLDVFFKRPNVQASILGNGSPVSESAEIILCTRRNTEVCRTIKVYATGQVEVLKSVPAP